MGKGKKNKENEAARRDAKKALTDAEERVRQMPGGISSKAGKDAIRPVRRAYSQTLRELDQQEGQ